VAILLLIAVGAVDHDQPYPYLDLVPAAHALGRVAPGPDGRLVFQPGRFEMTDERRPGDGGPIVRFVPMP
jgi:hypothetical protein